MKLGDALLQYANGNLIYLGYRVEHVGRSIFRSLMRVSKQNQNIAGFSVESIDKGKLI